MTEKETLTVKDHTPRPINPEDESSRDVMMLFSDQPVKPKYWFEDFGDYWSCSCGQINRSATCSNCGLDRELLRRLFKGGALETAHSQDRSKSAKDASTPKGKGASSSVTGADAEADQGQATGQGDGAGHDKTSDQSGSAGHDKSADQGGSARRAKAAGQSGSAGRGEEQGGVAFDPADDDSYLSEEEAELIAYNRRKRRTKVVMVILVLLLAMLGAGLAAFYYYGIPELNRQEDAEANSVKDVLVTELAGVLAPVSELDFDIECNLGDYYYDKKQYEKAIDHYMAALKIKDDASIRHKLNAAKFSYVSENRDKGGAVFEDYLEDLYKAKYSGIQEIYNSYYSWKATIVTNTSSGDYSSDMTAINRINTIYFHTTFSGGPPNETLDLYYEITWPDGSSEKRAVSENKGSGETLTTSCHYTFPATPGESKLTYKLYNNSDNRQLASDSITLQ